MNWLTNYVRPKIKAVLERKKETPDNLWHKCKGCGQLIFAKEFEANLSVCTNCGFHERIGPDARLESLFDGAKYDYLELPKSKDDPLGFKDQKRYAERLKDARKKTGDRDAVKVAVGTMGGSSVVIAVQNSFFMGGSMGVAVGDALVTAAMKSIELKVPLIIVTAAGGARMQEGILSLMQLPKITVSIDMLREAGLPYIVVLCDPTTGGVTASYGMLGDVQIAEPGALIGFAGPRVIEDTIREKLPEGFQRSEYLLEHGMIDMVVPRGELRDVLIRLMAMLTNDGEGNQFKRRAAAG